MIYYNNILTYLQNIVIIIFIFAYNIKFLFCTFIGCNFKYSKILYSQNYQFPSLYIFFNIFFYKCITIVIYIVLTYYVQLDKNIIQ